MSNGNFPLSTWLDSQKSSVGSWHLVTSESAWPTESPSSHSERVGAYTVNDQLKCQCTLHGWGYVSYILDWCGVKNHCSWALASVHCARAPGYTLWYSHIWHACTHVLSNSIIHSSFISDVSVMIAFTETQVIPKKHHQDMSFPLFCVSPMARIWISGRMYSIGGRAYLLGLQYGSGLWFST